MMAYATSTFTSVIPLPSSFASIILPSISFAYAATTKLPASSCNTPTSSGIAPTSSCYAPSSSCNDPASS